MAIGRIGGIGDADSLFPIAEPPGKPGGSVFSGKGL